MTDQIVEALAKRVRDKLLFEDAHVYLDVDAMEALKALVALAERTEQVERQLANLKENMRVAWEAAVEAGQAAEARLAEAKKALEEIECLEYDYYSEESAEFDSAREIASAARAALQVKP